MHLRFDLVDDDVFAAVGAVGKRVVGVFVVAVQSSLDDTDDVSWII